MRSEKWKRRLPYIAGSSNGRTADFESAHLGSNPSPATFIPGSSKGRTADSESVNRGSNPWPGTFITSNLPQTINMV